MELTKQDIKILIYCKEDFYTTIEILTQLNEPCSRIYFEDENHIIFGPGHCWVSLHEEVKDRTRVSITELIKIIKNGK